MEATSSTTSLSVTREQKKSSPTSGTLCATQGTVIPYGENLQRLRVSVSVKANQATLDALLRVGAVNVETVTGE